MLTLVSLPFTRPESRVLMSHVPSTCQGVPPKCDRPPRSPWCRCREQGDSPSQCKHHSCQPMTHQASEHVAHVRQPAMLTLMSLRWASDKSKAHQYTAVQGVSKSMTARPAHLDVAAVHKVGVQRIGQRQLAQPRQARQVSQRRALVNGLRMCGECGKSVGIYSGAQTRAMAKPPPT